MGDREKKNEKQVNIETLKLPSEQNEAQAGSFSVTALNPLVLTTARYEPGRASHYLCSLDDSQKRLIGAAELAYYQGKPDEAVAIARKLDEGSIDSCFAKTLISVMAALSMGNINDIFQSYFELSNAIGIDASNPSLIKTGDFMRLFFNIMIHNIKGIHFPQVSVYAFAVSESLKPMAIYSYAHYLQLCGDSGRAVGLAEGALVMMEHTCPISEIYLALIIAIGYISRRMWEKAEYYFRYAWSLAEPDSIIMPFAEYRGLLTGLLEKCLRYDNPEVYRSILELANRYHKNWIYIHNEITGDTVTDKLTAIEFNIAMLASRDYSNIEIASHLDISVNSVRAHLRNIFNKLGVDSRKQLGKFVIK